MGSFCIISPAIFGRLLIGLPLVLRVIYMELVRNHLWIEDGTRWERLQAFHPYIWFVIGIWLCYEAINQIVRGPGRIIMWLLVQVAVFGILDSLLRIYYGIRSPGSLGRRSYGSSGFISPR